MAEVIATNYCFFFIRNPLLIAH